MAAALKRKQPHSCFRHECMKAWPKGVRGRLHPKAATKQRLPATAIRLNKSTVRLAGQSCMEESVDCATVLIGFVTSRAVRQLDDRPEVVVLAWRGRPG